MISFNARCLINDISVSKKVINLYIMDLIKKCEIQATLISLYPNGYSQELNYCLFAVKLDKCVGSCNTLNDLSNKVCVSIKTKDLNLSRFAMISGINELEALTKQISCGCKCKFDEKKCN